MHFRNTSDSYPYHKGHSAKRVITAAVLAIVLISGLIYANVSLNNHLANGFSRFSSFSSSSTSASSTKYTSPASAAYHTPANAPGHITSTLVIGALSKAQSKLTWLSSLTSLTSEPIIYIVDNTTAPHHLDRNRGREAAVYLKYIIEHYDTLSDVTIFWHPDEVAWHNNLLLSLSSADAINRFSRAAVLRHGYVNARVDAWPGCPAWIAYNPTPAEHALHSSRMADGFSEAFFRQKFPNDAPESVPRYFANACCSQFGVSRDAVRSRPLEDYQRLYEWVSTDVLDQFTGRMMEYLWPFIFTRRGVNCPEPVKAYCEVYGICLDENGEEARLLGEWIEGYRRTEEIGEGMGETMRAEERGAVEQWKEHKEMVKAVMAEIKGEGAGSLASEKEEQQTEEELSKEEEDEVKDLAAKKLRATDGWKKMKNDQWRVWQKTKESRKRLANMMELKNGAGDQKMAGIGL